MILSDVMDELATQLDTISGLRTFAFPPDSVVPPAAIISYPETYTYDETYGRGMDRMTLPAIVVVGRLSDRSTRDLLSAYVDGSGSSSVKAVVEAGSYTACHTVRVASVSIDVVTIGGDDLLAGTFDFDITGSGS